MVAGTMLEWPPTGRLPSKKLKIQPHACKNGQTFLTASPSSEATEHVGIEITAGVFCLHTHLCGAVCCQDLTGIYMWFPAH